MIAHGQGRPVSGRRPVLLLHGRRRRQGRLDDVRRERRHDLARKAPYSEWLQERRTVVDLMPFDAEVEAETPADMIAQLTAFGWSLEDLEMQVGDMSNAGKETLFSLGEDTALAVLSDTPHTLYDYFKQRFAQVTNPPIDPLREGVVMSLEMSIGSRHDLVDAPAEGLAKQTKLRDPGASAASRDAPASALPTTCGCPGRRRRG